MTTQAMDEGKRKLIKFLFDNGLGVFEDPANDRTLKSKRLSPWFLNKIVIYKNCCWGGFVMYLNSVFLF